MRRRAITVIGRVQGVGFRYFTYDNARKYSLTGWVRNNTEGGVAIEVQGPAQSLDAFIAEINEGPALARVRELQIVDMPLSDGEEGFEVRY